MHQDNNIKDNIHTTIHMLFGQFLDHDLSRTAISMLAANAEGQLWISSFFIPALCLNSTAVYSVTDPIFG